MVLFKPFDWASLFSQYSGAWFLSLLSLISLSTPNLIPDLGCGDIEKNHWGAGHELLGFHAIYTNFFLAGLSQPLTLILLLQQQVHLHLPAVRLRARAKDWEAQALTLVLLLQQQVHLHLPAVCLRARAKDREARRNWGKDTACCHCEHKPLSSTAGED